MRHISGHSEAHYKHLHMGYVRRAPAHTIRRGMDRQSVLITHTLCSVAEWLRARDTLTISEGTVCGRS